MVRRPGEIPSPFTSELIFQFTAAHLYEWDEPKRSDRPPAGSIVERVHARAAVCELVRSTAGLLPRQSAASKIACAHRAAAAHRRRDGRASAVCSVI